MLKSVSRILLWASALVVVQRMILGCPGGCGKKLVRQQSFSVYQSETAWSINELTVRFSTRANVDLKTRYANLRMISGSIQDMPEQIIDDLIGKGAPLWKLAS